MRYLDVTNPGKNQRVLLEIVHSGVRIFSEFAFQQDPGNAQSTAKSFEIVIRNPGNIHPGLRRFSDILTELFKWNILVSIPQRTVHNLYFHWFEFRFLSLRINRTRFDSSIHSPAAHRHDSNNSQQSQQEGSTAKAEGNHG